MNWTIAIFASIRHSLSYPLLGKITDKIKGWEEGRRKKEIYTRGTCHLPLSKCHNITSLLALIHLFYIPYQYMYSLFFHNLSVKAHVPYLNLILEKVKKKYREEVEKKQVAEFRCDKSLRIFFQDGKVENRKVVVKRKTERKVLTLETCWQLGIYMYLATISLFLITPCASLPTLNYSWSFQSTLKLSHIEFALTPFFHSLLIKWLFFWNTFFTFFTCHFISFRLITRSPFIAKLRHTNPVSMSLQYLLFLHRSWKYCTCTIVHVFS